LRVVKIDIPPDKSVSHRAVILASISEGSTRIKNLLTGEDCLRTIEAFRAMGVRIDVAAATDVVIYGVGMRGLKRPKRPIYLGNSGTTMRILPGVLAGQDFSAILKGDKSLSKRPMLRIVGPLRRMGAEISGARLKVSASGGKGDVYPPLKIHGGRLKAIKYKSKIASAQIKSCILLAGLFARGVTSVSEPVKSRDHTERMLGLFGCKVNKVSVKGPVQLKSPRVVDIPGDISSAAFFIVAGCILPDTKIVIKNVGLNPTRSGVLDILKKMGARIEIQSPKSKIQNKEPIGNIIVQTSILRGIRISPGEVVRAIDEIPIIMVAACFAKGETVIEGVGELRVKETDRVKSMVTNLRKMGADVKVEGDSLKVKGGKELHGARVSSYGDHRTAMSMLVAGLLVKDNLRVTGLSCIKKSFPGFEKMFSKLQLSFPRKRGSKK